MPAFQLTYPHVVLAVVVLTAALLLYLWRRAPQLVHERGGQVLLFVGAFVMVIVAGGAGLSKNMESATETSFCLSCHEMQPYGKSLHIDDSEPVPATHFQNRLIPRDHACFTCHTDYSMFGDLKAKMNGMRHMYVHYIAGVPEQIHLYRPFDNNNCLHCHDGMRSFEESKHHRSDKASLAQLRAGAVSCLDAGCHDVAHNVAKLGEQEFWPPAAEPAAPAVP